MPRRYRRFALWSRCPTPEKWCLHKYSMYLKPSELGRKSHATWVVNFVYFKTHHTKYQQNEKNTVQYNTTTSLSGVVDLFGQVAKTSGKESTDVFASGSLCFLAHLQVGYVAALRVLRAVFGPEWAARHIYLCIYL